VQYGSDDMKNWKQASRRFVPLMTIVLVGSFIGLVIWSSSGTSVSLADPSSVVVIGGAIDESGPSPQADIRIVRRITQIPDTVLEEHGKKLSIIKDARLTSRYSITVEDKRGTVLESRPILRWFATQRATDHLGFFEIIPFPDHAAKVVVRSDEDSLQEYVVTANSPEIRNVKILEHAPSRHKLFIEWEGKDDDGDQLTYDVLYIYNEGRYSKPLALGYPETSLEYVHTDELPGSDSGVVRVIASDGLNTGQGDSDAFKVPNKPPLVAIQSPTDQAEILQGGTVVLLGTAMDLERGPIPGDSLIWSSDVQGDLGRGSEIGTRTLSLGTHEITLTADDSDGLSSSDSITLQIITR
jgi:hypothetical protein